MDSDVQQSVGVCVCVCVRVVVEKWRFHALCFWFVLGVTFHLSVCMPWYGEHHYVLVWLLRADDGKGCDKPFHLKCVKLTKVPAGDWFCEKCSKKK